MITKHVAMKTVQKSDFGGLVKYITDEQGKQERILFQSITNCHSDDPFVAAIEVENIQSLNKRATSDKTYHLIISFPAGESPTDGILKEIEARMCQGLGFGEHQRVSAVHHDTDNLHIHVAINKIHPTRYTIHEPYNDYWTRGKICDKLEREFGLQADNHQAKKRGGENRAADMERHAGIESLIGWIQRECVADIRSAKTWHEIHHILYNSNLELRLHGNGLVLADRAGNVVKVSSVARDLSKPRLEAKLGNFEPSTRQEAARATRPAKCYERKPVRFRINTAELFARYQAEQREGNAARAAVWHLQREAKNRLIEAAKRSGRFKRAAIKLMGGDRLGKKLLYAAIAKTLKSEIQRISQAHQRQHEAATEQHRKQAWADWLRSQATAGNADALTTLRAREAAQGLQGNTLRARSRSGTAPLKSIAAADAVQDGVTKKGTVIYRVGSSAIRDDGDRLNVSRNVTQEGLEAALRLAHKRYGDLITVNGTDEFKEQIARAAAASRLPITFDDEALDRRRQTLIATTKENVNDNNADRGRVDQSSAGRSGHGSAARGIASGSARGASADLVTGTARGTTAERNGCRKPDIARVGRKPPPTSQNRLRGLSQLGVVRHASRSEVLLPRDVPHHVEQQGPADIDSVRRGISRPRDIALAPPTAAEKYIAEREGKREKGFDIPKHTRYTDRAESTVAYSGIRQIEGQLLALLKRDDEVMVLPVDEATARRLKRVALGELVTVTPKGTIKTKGRSR